MPLSAARALLCGPRYALQFDGISNYVKVANSASLNPSEGTWVFWAKLKRGDGKYKGIIAKYGYDASLGTYTGWDFYIDPYNRAIFYFRYPERIELYDYNPIFDSFVCYALANDGSYSLLYRNGELIAEGAMTFPAPTSHDIYVGMRRPGDLQGDHTISIICFYSRALSAKEILWNFNHRDNPVRNGLVLWLHWDSIDIDAGMWYDKTVFANHGTIYGATLAEPIKLKARILSPVRSLSPAR